MNKKFRPAQPKTGLGKNLTVTFFFPQEIKTQTHTHADVYACVIVQMAVQSLTHHPVSIICFISQGIPTQLDMHIYTHT